MSDFTSDFWSVYVAVLTVVSIIACGILLYVMGRMRVVKGKSPDTTGHVWDEDLAEYNNPLPRWWMWLFYITIAFVGWLIWFLYRSRAGLVLRSVGESPESAHALGYPVRRIRLAALVVGGALCGIAGVYVSVVYTHLWVEGMTAGKGWIALALTTFATWRPARVLLGAYLFGGVTMLQLQLQGEGVQISSQFLTMLPYLATILVLVLISRNASFIRVNMPASIGKPFFPG